MARVHARTLVSDFMPLKVFPLNNSGGAAPHRPHPALSPDPVIQYCGAMPSPSVRPSVVRPSRPNECIVTFPTLLLCGRQPLTLTRWAGKGERDRESEVSLVRPSRDPNQYCTLETREGERENGRARRQTRQKKRKLAGD